MTTHLYCVVPGSCPLPAGLVGIAGALVRAVGVEGLSAWVSDVDRSQPLTIDAVKAHDAVAQAALDSGVTPAPARYGQRFDDDAACSDALRARADAIRAALSDVDGCVEMTLVLAPPASGVVRDLEPVTPDAVGQEGAGRRYLETIRSREAAAAGLRRELDPLAGRLSAATGRYVRRSSVQHNPPPNPGRTVSHLVERELVATYRAAAESVEPPAGSRVLIIGPRPPYTFASLRQGPDGGLGMNLAG